MKKILFLLCLSGANFGFAASPVWLIGYGPQTPSYTPTPVLTATATFTPTPSFTPTSTPTGTWSPNPTLTATNTYTPTPVYTATPAYTVTPTLTPTPLPDYLKTLQGTLFNQYGFYSAVGVTGSSITFFGPGASPTPSGGFARILVDQGSVNGQGGGVTFRYFFHNPQLNLWWYTGNVVSISEDSLTASSGSSNVDGFGVSFVSVVLTPLATQTPDILVQISCPR